MSRGRAILLLPRWLWHSIMEKPSRRLSNSEILQVVLLSGKSGQKSFLMTNFFHMIKILRFIDTYIFGFIILLFCWIRYLPRKSSPLPKKILVIRIWALGSSLLTYPMIHELRKNFPDVTIHLLASKRNQSVYRNQGIFDAIFDVFSWKGLWHMWRHFLSYDVVIDAEDYFHLSALISLWTGKKTI